LAGAQISLPLSKWHRRIAPDSLFVYCARPAMLDWPISRYMCSFSLGPSYEEGASSWAWRVVPSRQNTARRTVTAGRVRDRILSLLSVVVELVIRLKLLQYVRLTEEDLQ
jgi:hypothetical protein